MAQSKWNPWFWGALILNPANTLDLVDADGNTDHAKVVPFIVLVASFAAHFMGNPIPLWHLITMFSAAFGYSSWRTFLKAKMVSRTDTTADTKVTTVNHSIVERRDHDRGIDPA